MSQQRVAIVILVVNKPHILTFNLLFRLSVSKYCDRHGYDLHVLTELIEPLEPFVLKKFYWQRLLIPSLPQFQQYDFVVSLDADIFISESAPSLPQVSPGKIGAVNERKYFGNYDWRETIQKKMGWELTGIEWYRQSGEERSSNDHLQGGLLIYQPIWHGDLMKRLYSENISNFMKYYQDDQSFLSIYALDNDCIEWLDQRFNCVWFFWKEIMYPDFDHYPQHVQIHLVRNFINLNWFTHWTGRYDLNHLENVRNLAPTGLTHNF